MNTESALAAQLFDTSGEWLPEHGYGPAGHQKAFHAGFRAAYRNGVAWADQATHVLETGIGHLERTGCAECVAWARLKHFPSRSPIA